MLLFSQERWIYPSLKEVGGADRCDIESKTLQMSPQQLANELCVIRNL